MKEQNAEDLGQTVDRIESLVAGLDIPLPPAMHIEQLKSMLPEIAENLKKIHIEETGENPWE